MESERCGGLTLKPKQGSTRWSKFNRRRAACCFMRYLNLFILLAACASCAGAEDISTTNGELFKNAEVIRFEADGLVVRHDGGTNRIGWKELPAAARQRYRAEARKQKEKEVQRLKQDLARAESEAARLKQDEGQPESKNPP